MTFTQGIILLVMLPFIVYFAVKLGTAGYFSGKSMFFRREHLKYGKENSNGEER
jgi:hypothetical protein